MDIYSFIPSRDIAEHCQKIGQQFTSAEMAAIIYRSDKPLKEKHRAYRKIIAEFPDMPMPIKIDTIEERREWFRELFLTPPIIEGEPGEVHEVSQKAAASLHIYLKEWMEWETQLEKDFSTVLSESQNDAINQKYTRYRINEYSYNVEEIFKKIQDWTAGTDNTVEIIKLTTDYTDYEKFEMNAKYTIYGEMKCGDYFDKVAPTSPDSIPICISLPFQKGDEVEIMVNDRTYRHGCTSIYNMTNPVIIGEDSSTEGNLYYTDEKGETHKDACFDDEVLRLCYARK